MKTLIKNYVDFKISLILLTFLTIFFSIQSYSQRNCGYYEKLEELQKNAEFKIGRINFERKLQNYLKNISHNRNGDIYKIPVVVHIVLNNPNSIPNSRVYDQIDILNKDFRALNTDVTQVPSVFQSLISDTRFEFYLAEVGPDCNGITRTVTTQGRFYNDNIKKTSKKGRDPIDTEHILNIWVGTITEGVLGWTQPVGGPAETDGVVIADWCFGYTNSPSFGLGRTTTHEIGHYFNLDHIWGPNNCAENDIQTCTDSDNVDDTPNQLGCNGACPTFPHITCNNGPNGDLFMNYMDYVNDNCMHLFTTGQSDRMRACLNVARPGLLQEYIGDIHNVNIITNGSNCHYMEATAVVGCGRPPYTYIWSTGAISQTIVNLTAGTYSVTVTNQLGFTATASTTISNEIIVTADHPYLSEVIQQNNLDPEVLSNRNIYVEDELIIDQNYIFENCNLSFAENAQMTVQPNRILYAYGHNENKTKFQGCGSRWQGIIAEENSSVYVTNSEILDAKFPITCKNNSLLSLEKTKIENFETALTLQDNVTLSLFEENSFNNGNKGIDAKNCTFLDLKAMENSRNKFSNLDIGIYLNNCSADIEYNDIENVRIGILTLMCFMPVDIKYNNIGYNQSGIVANITGDLNVEKNIIGYNNQFGDNGIKIISGRNSFIFDNEIHAVKNGILNFQNNAYISTNLFNVDGYYCDGISYSGSDSYMYDNLIFVSGGEAGIDAFVGKNHYIENNEVIMSNSIPYTSAGMIKLQGPLDNTIKENILAADHYANGVLLENSGSNLLECNDITTNASEVSMNIGYNSEFQDIKTNKLDGFIDLEVKAELGVQRDKGNEFLHGDDQVYAIGLTSDEILRSQFFANPAYANQYPEFVYPQELFKTSSNSPEICKVIQGPGNINIYDDPVRLCDYYSRIKLLKTTNPKLYLTKLKHILDYLNLHKKQIPNCIKIDVQKLCGIGKLSEVYVRLIQINSYNKERILPQERLREMIKQGQNDEVRRLISSDDYRVQWTSDMRLLDTLRNSLDSIRCPDSLINVWKKVLISYISVISGDSMNIATRQELTQIAKLCAYDYGESVNLARMMLSDQDTTNYNVYDNCRDQLYRRDIAVEKGDELEIFPNPTSGNITILLPSEWKQTSIEIYNLTGSLIEQVNAYDSMKIELNLGLENGIYLCKLHSSDGEIFVKKFIVIK